MTPLPPLYDATALIEIVMPKARRVSRKSFPFRLETLESRALMSVGGVASSVSAPWASGETVNAASAVLVKFQTSSSQSEISADLAAVGGRVATRYPDGPTLVSLAPWADLAGTLTALRADNGVVYAEADAPLHAEGSVIPNNPLFNQEWGMTLIDAPQAWGITTGSASIIVAVLDTGIDTRNAAFAGRIWNNPDPYSGRLGYRGDLHGWNFVSNTANIQDNNGHGSHVTGIIAATGNNGIGTAGVNWKAQIMPLKVLDSGGNGSTDAAVSAVYYAVQHGAKVINASWGGDVFSQSMLDALNYADRAGVVFVTAAGNDGLDNDQVTTYPASFRTSNELVVAALDASGTLASYSNYGATTVDLAAPGTDILSTVLYNQYQRYTGTSMASPFVAGTVALLAGQNPGMTAEQLVAQIKATAKPIASLAGKMISPGVVDPYFALTNHKSTTTGGNSALSLVPGTSSFADIEASVLIGDNLYQALGSNPANYVTYVFQAILDREPAASDITYFTSAFQIGLTRLDFVRAIQTTPEGYRSQVAHFLQDELGWTQALAELKSDPTVISLANLLPLGVSKTDILVNVLSSDSYRKNAGGTDAAWISAIYSVVFDRPVDAFSLSAFTAALSSGGLSREVLVRSLLGTAEAKQTAIAHLFQDDFNWTDTIGNLKANSGVVFLSTYLVSA